MSASQTESGKEAPARWNLPPLLRRSMRMRAQGAELSRTPLRPYEKSHWIGPVAPRRSHARGVRRPALTSARCTTRSGRETPARLVHSDRAAADIHSDGGRVRAFSRGAPGATQDGRVCRARGGGCMPCAEIVGSATRGSDRADAASAARHRIRRRRPVRAGPVLSRGVARRARPVRRGERCAPATRARIDARREPCVSDAAGALRRPGWRGPGAGKAAANPARSTSTSSYYFRTGQQ